MFRIKNTNNTVASTFTVDIASSDAKYKNYELTVLPENNFTVVSGSQIQTIDLYLEDNSTDKPVSGELVNLEFFNGKEGSVNLFSASTDSKGHVAFNYTAPDDISDVNGTEFSLNFSLDKNTSIKASTKVIFDSSKTLKDYTGYTLSLVDANRTITEGSQTEVFDLFLKNTNNEPAEGDTITVDFFDGNKGTLNAFEGTTDSNGHVAFNYTAPDNPIDTNITFRIKNTTISTQAILKVDSALNDKPKIRVDAEDSTITLTEDSQNVSVKILAFNSNNEVFDSGSIVVRYPQFAVDGNASIGKFVEKEVEISNGEAVFAFNGPSVLEAINSLNFTFVYKENVDVNTTLTVKYEPETIDIVLPETTKEITVNNQPLNIEVKAFDSKNNPYNSGVIKIKYPDDVKDGRDIGSFKSSEVSLVDGKAVFEYTAPSNLDDNTSDIVFKFYHDSDPSKADDNNFTITINPEANQTILTNYNLTSSITESDVTMDLNGSKLVAFYVKDADGNLVPDENMTSIKVTSKNVALGTLEDTKGNKGNELTINNKNSVSINVRSKKLSGLLPLEVEAKFKDANGEEQNLTKTFNLVVLSGPPSAISISYVGTKEDKENAKYIQTMVVTVTDKYNNLVDSNPAVSMGVLAGYAQDSSGKANNSAGYLYFRSRDNAHNGSINASNNKFTAQDEVFENVDQTNQYLTIFGDGYVYDVSGKWDIQVDTNKTLDLVDDYNGSDTDKLGFAVGNNFRQDMCEDGVGWVANVYPTDKGNYSISDNGSMKIDIEYDYYLTGKDVVLWVNLVGSHDGNITRIGEAKKITLRGNGLTSETYSFSKGFQGEVKLHIMVSDTEYLKNSNFGYSVKVDSDDANWTVIDDSMEHNITYCYGDQNQTGESYVDINFTSPTPKAGTVSLQNLIIGNEF